MSAPATAPPRPASWPMLRTMVGVGLVCGILIVATYQATKPVIARNRAEALQAAIFQVLPNVTSSKTFELTDAGTFEPLEGEAAADAELVYAGYNDSGELVGLAIEGAGMGYQDTVTLLWGYEPGDQKTVGMQVLESKETPGLGDKISSDQAFQENFTALDVSLNGAGAGLANAVVAVKHGKKTDPWQIDGITGATISSTAVSKILNDSATFWLPLIRKNLEVFQSSKTTASRPWLGCGPPEDLCPPTSEPWAEAHGQTAFHTEAANHGD